VVRQFEFRASEETTPYEPASAGRTGISDGLWCHAQGTEPGERSRDRLHVFAFVDDDAKNSSSSLIFFDRYFSQEVKQAGVDAARAPHKNAAD
jgi:hypothetical protein